MKENGTVAGKFHHMMETADDIAEVNELRVEGDSNFGGGIYTFLKFVGCSSVLLTQCKAVFRC
jgi:hypothetical protein